MYWLKTNDYLRFFTYLLTVITWSVTANQVNSSDEVPLRLAVAANFSPVLEKLLPRFIAETQIQTQIISASTGTLYLQIKHGAPFDVFLAADDVRPQKLVEENLVVPDSLHTYAYGQLALWSNTNQQIPLSVLNTLLENEKRFAIANPDIAPYGKAAKEVLEHLQLWSSYQNHLVMGININQTFQQLRSKAVNVGIVANSQLQLNNLVGTVIPSEYYHPIKQQLVIIKSSRQKEKAKKFSQYLLNENSQKIISSYGYTPLNDALSPPYQGLLLTDDK